MYACMATGTAVDHVFPVCSEEYTDILFHVMEKIQRMHFSEQERNLLKLVGLFSAGQCSSTR